MPETLRNDSACAALLSPTAVGQRYRWTAHEWHMTNWLHCQLSTHSFECASKSSDCLIMRTRSQVFTHTARHTHFYFEVAPSASFLVATPSHRQSTRLECPRWSNHLSYYGIPQTGGCNCCVRATAVADLTVTVGKLCVCDDEEDDDRTPRRQRND